MAKKTNNDDRSIEQKLQRLEEIGAVLDRGTVPLDDQLTLFEEGVRLAQECRAYIEQAKLKVMTLGGELPDPEAEA